LQFAAAGVQHGAAMHDDGHIADRHIRALEDLLGLG
jgi:hypothetical protein